VNVDYRDIFLSHSGLDKEAVRRIAAAIESEKLEWARPSDVVR